MHLDKKLNAANVLTGSPALFGGRDHSGLYLRGYCRPSSELAKIIQDMIVLSLHLEEMPEIADTGRIDVS